MKMIVIGEKVRFQPIVHVYFEFGKRLNLTLAD